MTEFEQDPANLPAVGALTAEIVGAYVGHHTVASNDLPDLITMVGNLLAGLGQTPDEPKEKKPIPAVQFERSLTPDHIICLEDGKKLKMLKRRLKTCYDLTPNEYRRRWGLNDDYPMVAPSYAAQRSGQEDRPRPQARAYQTGEGAAQAGCKKACRQEELIVGRAGERAPGTVRA